LVCGHESLTGFIRPNLQRPLVAKIHRDLLLNPKNEPAELEKLPKEWVSALKMIFESYTPIVIGYGGNDGSLMGFLESLPPIKGGLFWCYRTGDEPDIRIHKIVKKHDGSMVPILGFDELMLQLWEKLKLKSPKGELQDTHAKRVMEWQRQFEELDQRVKAPGATQATERELKPVREAATAAIERLTKEKDWWAWQLKANAEPDPAKQEAIYRDGLKDFPESSELTANFALFMEERGNHEEAEKLYRKALKLAPGNPAIAANFADFMENVRKDYDEAERLYRQALELDPKDATYTGNFANFMKNVRKKYDEAEHLYRKALELDPTDATYSGNFAIFMNDAKQNYAEAHRFFRRAVKLDPKDPYWKKQLAKFLKAHPQFK
jgi:tetratricopeptide (TPR) repeat protein